MRSFQSYVAWMAQLTTSFEISAMVLSCVHSVLKMNTFLVGDELERPNAIEEIQVADVINPI